MNQLTPAQATVIASIISGLVAVIVCIINSHAQQKKMSAEFAAQERQRMEEFQKQEETRRREEAVRDAELRMWMKGVNEKLDTHNGYAEKLGEIQTDIAVIKNDIKTLYKQA